MIRLKSTYNPKNRLSLSDTFIHIYNENNKIKGIKKRITKNK